MLELQRRAVEATATARRVACDRAGAIQTVLVAFARVRAALQRALARAARRRVLARAAASGLGLHWLN